MVRKRLAIFLCALAFTLWVVIVVGCAGIIGNKPLTPKQQATIWMNIYISEYDDTMAMAINPSATPAQKEMVAKKKAILTKVWPLLKVYIAIVDSGGIPTQEATNDLINLINQLTGLATGGI